MPKTLTDEDLRLLDAYTQQIADDYHFYVNSDEGELPDIDVSCVRELLGLSPYEPQMPDEEDEKCR